MNTAITRELTASAEQLLIAAEKLLAEKGLGAVSVREIARAAGQKNHSAISYHFGAIDDVIDAILSYRMLSLNEKRSERLAQWRAAGHADDLRGLVQVLVKPFADELLLPPEHSYYLRLLAQLMSQREWQPLFTEDPVRAAAVLETGYLMAELLTPVIGEELAVERLRLLGLHSLNTITEWDAMRRRGELVLNDETLRWRVDNLVDYLLGGLTAPATKHQEMN
jgi:AcrR family transcriptional regulator